MDPASGRELAQFPELDGAGIEAAIARAWGSRHSWRDIGVDMRATLLRSVAGVLRADKARYAALATAETGKPIIGVAGGVEQSARRAELPSGHAARLVAYPPSLRTPVWSSAR